MMTIELNQVSGRLSRPAIEAVLTLWASRRFSTADIAELLAVPETRVVRIVASSKAHVLQGTASA